MKKKVLVVDDAAMARCMSREALVAAGFDVIEAENGKAALPLVDASVACILCDINMPVMNGLEFLEALAERGVPHAPVLIVSTESEVGLVQRARKLGALGWILKPFKEESLQLAVKKVACRPERDSQCAS